MPLGQPEFVMYVNHAHLLDKVKQWNLEFPSTFMCEALRCPLIVEQRISPTTVRVVRVKVDESKTTFSLEFYYPRQDFIHAHGNS